MIAHAAAGVEDSWAIASDRHGRIYTTAVGSTFGSLRSWRLEDLLASGTPTPRSSAIVSWSLGANPATTASTGTVLSDRAEAIPRKLKILLKDSELDFTSFDELMQAFAPSTAVEENGEFRVASFAIPVTGDGGDYPYWLQRITIENQTLDMRWSADATQVQPALIERVVARPGDQMRVLFNQRTYGVISLFGYGVAVWDLNAVDSNDAPTRPSDWKVVREQVRLTNGAFQDVCVENPATPDAIQDLTFSPDAAILAGDDGTVIPVYGVEVHDGILDLHVHPVSGTAPSTGADCDERAPFGMNLGDNPRMAAFRTKFHDLAERDPIGRFSGIDTYHWRREAQDNAALAEPVSPGDPGRGIRGSSTDKPIVRDYLLVPGYEYGLLVVEAAGTNPKPLGDWLTDNRLVDVIWIPDGAMSVRVVPRTNFAVVVDGAGRVLLIDLSKLDERFDSEGIPIDSNAIFPTLAASLRDNGPYGVGIDDPRIIWRSEPGLVSGTLPPVVDTDTGMVYAGRVGEKTTKIVAATDPRLRIMVDVGASGGLGEAGGVVPLGIDPPADVLKCNPETETNCNASLGAFRMELTLPGAINESLAAANQELNFALESETVPGARAPDPRSPIPPASRKITMQRLIPAGMEAELRHQKGFNKWISPWIVALADPRASEKWDWHNATAQQKRDAGCYACARPPSLRNNPDAIEIFSAGRDFAVRPGIVNADGTQAPGLFRSSDYAYLDNANRLALRFATIMADTVRDPHVLVAAQNPPVAGGAFESTIFLHSGELELDAVDLNAGGRAGWNVVFARRYRSRTIGGTALGAGWESNMFQRLRALPDGDVEYRDGMGGIWRFRSKADDPEIGPPSPNSYVAPKGLFLNLSRTDRGWVMTDQKWRVTAFDDYGRLVSEGDDFVSASLSLDQGNTIRYLYDANGRLARIIDPVGRVSELHYFDNPVFPSYGLVREIVDWRGRTLTFNYVDGRLNQVYLPDIPNTSGGRPMIAYRLEDSVSTGYNDLLELKPNITSVTDPAGPAARVSFAWGSGAARDEITGETWGTGETTTVDRSDPLLVRTTDALGQVRETALPSATLDYASDRVHPSSITELAVPTSETPFGQLPVGLFVAGDPVSPRDRTWHFDYNDEGLVKTSTLDGVRKVTNAWIHADGAPGLVLQSTETAPLISGLSASSVHATSDPITRIINYQSGPNASTFVRSMTAAGLEIQSLEPHRNRLSPVTINDQISSSAEYDTAGLLKSVSSSGGSDGSSGTSEVTIEYQPETAPEHERALPKEIDNAGLVNRIDYPDEDTVVETDPRGVTTTTKYNAWRLPVSADVIGPQLTMHESWTYDANGRVRTHRRDQGPDTVTTTFDYDVMGRTTSVTTDNVEIGGETGVVTTTMDYDLRNHRITTTRPGGAVETSTLDSLGRVAHSDLNTGTGSIQQDFSYDLDNNLVHETNGFWAMAFAFDAHGRQIAAMHPDETRTITEYDAWDRPVGVEQRDAHDQLIGQSTMDLTPAGRVEAVETKIDEAQTSNARFAWDGGGRTTAVEMNGRASRSRFDSSGRFVSSEIGAGSLAGLTDVFSRTTAQSHDGAYVMNASHAERGGEGNYQSVHDPQHRRRRNQRDPRESRVAAGVRPGGQRHPREGAGTPGGEL